MKQFLIRTILLAILPFVGLAVAQESVTIKYWTLFTGGDKQFMDAMVEEFMSQNPEIVIEPLTAKWENYYDFLTTALAGGNAPDVAIMHMTAIPGFASQGALYNLDEMVDEYGIEASDFLEIPWQRSSYEGSRYGIPLDVHPLVFFYNPAIFEEAGLLDDQGRFSRPETREGWIEAMQAVKEQTDAVPYPLASMGAAAYRDWFSLLHQNGGSFLNEDNSAAAFNSPAGVDALQFWVDHVHEHEFSPEGLTFPQTFTMFEQGDSAMEGYGVWRTGAYEGTEGLEFEADVYPTFGDQPAWWANSHVFVLPRQRNRDEQRVEAALAFIDWMTNNTIMWTEAGHIPPRRSVIESEEYQSLPHRPLKDPALLENVVYPPLVVQLNEIENAVIEELQGALLGQKSAERALEDAERRVNSILRR
jgi:multiple sugar transport system substrate-binding protein